VAFYYLQQCDVIQRWNQPQCAKGVICNAWVLSPKTLKLQYKKYSTKNVSGRSFQKIKACFGNVRGFEVHVTNSEGRFVLELVLQHYRFWRQCAPYAVLFGYDLRTVVEISRDDFQHFSNLDSRMNKTGFYSTNVFIFIQQQWLGCDKRFLRYWLS